MRTPSECPFEAAVAGAAVGGRWLDDSASELRTHAQGCAFCADIVQVAMVFRSEHDAARQVRVPSAGQVWWRATVRARMEAAQAASRPMTWLQGMAGAAAAGLICAMLVLMWSPLTAAFASAVSVAVSFNPGVVDAAAPLLAAMKSSLPLMLGVAACIVLAPLLVLCVALLHDND
ncbi:MAG TPA: hypothetical protein VFV95_00765 [Vicinamibacterales bacterium]|nr:hypothetical protein [Vicinamibacterales bacterium]